MAGSKRSMRATARCCGNSKPARASSASRRRSKAPTENSTSRFCPASAAGPARSFRADSIPPIRRPRKAWPMRWRICRIIRRKEGRCMSSRCPKSLSRVCAGAAILLGAFFCSGALAENAPATGERVLRVAADPNNLPFSNDKLEGFENEIVALVARELHAKVEYVWWAQRRGFFRNMLKEHRADLVAGVPVHFDLALTTAPYYESGYVFVTRAADKLDLH